MDIRSQPTFSGDCKPENRRAWRRSDAPKPLREKVALRKYREMMKKRKSERSHFRWSDLGDRWRTTARRRLLVVTDREGEKGDEKRYEDLRSGSIMSASRRGREDVF
ncbi:hypothetical protein E3N88_44769 [Mikania micrantha]|uniref:Uncharacterized protein n=1 Tax=Mikania micrantha TaxID=192012 RepID=A0A5N6LBC8_9ASTR|nr:hypothetical protein E3N88_44769 [Mikania micrantha]